MYECLERVYLVMEFVMGGEFFDCIVSRGLFIECDVIWVLYMVLEGVCYFYLFGIIYCDFKFENLLYYYFGNDFRIMIIDFGFFNIW